MAAKCLNMQKMPPALEFLPTFATCFKMPYLLLLVNVQVSDEDAFSREFTKACVKALRRPEAEITTNITYNATGAAGSLGFGLTIVGLDTLDPETKEKCSNAFSKFMASRLGMPKDRGFIRFTNPGDARVAIKTETSD
ncbi:hypothetical protein DFH08DRAFT_134753 [Mycena albidolilacea]|uniref:Macrophage migration inhibitory factor n=1 Tax=Mycena albidolilacea TaxID=1033008 RepID=A0AAD7A4V4_9AGAR|nr:hypothetical protein DFH08DRAFT_134753 [Mycena albidolilacea]